MTGQDNIKLDEAIIDQAIEWQQRINDDAADDGVWMAYTDWLEASTDHQLAADHVEQKLNFIAENASDLSAAMDAAGVQQTPNPASMPANDTDTNIIQAASRFRRPSTWVGISAVAASFIFTILSFSNLLGPDTFIQQYQTGAGQRQMVSLEDGSSIHMNTQSQLTVTLASAERRVNMEFGEALFEVASDKERPFIVSVGGKDVRVVGTKFNIRRYDQKLTVTVAEGIVDVSEDQAEETDAPTGETVEKTRLTAGIQYVHDEQTDTDLVQEVDADIYTSWRDSVLLYENTPLKDVITDIARYLERPITLNDAVADVRFTGILNMSDPMASLTLLSDTLPIEVVSTSAEITIEPCEGCQPTAD